MERFLMQYEDRIEGSIAGFDRVLFRGDLRAISYPEGLGKYLSSQGILYKEFGDYAEAMSEKIKAHGEAIAMQAGRPYIYMESPKASKEEKAREIMQTDGIKEGLICVLRCVERCQSFNIRRDKETKKLRIVKQVRQCLHLYFYYLDREFGFMHIRLQTWFPFTIQVCINGREYLARQMDKRGIAYEQQDNCFTQIADITKAQALLDKLVERKWERVLGALARKVNPLLSAKNKFLVKNYYWTIRQSEYATDIMFRDAASLAEIYPQLVNHAITQMSSEDILSYLERRTNIRFSGEVKSSLQKRLTGTRVKHWVEENSIKMYDKKGSVLRVETTINNPWRFRARREVVRKGKPVMAWLPMRKGIADIARRVEISRAANERYLQALAVVGNPQPSYRLLDTVSKAIVDKPRRYRPMRPIAPDDSQLFTVIMRGEFALQGFRNRDLRTHLKDYTAARITRLLALLRAHKLIYKVHKTNYYRITDKGRLIMSTAIKFRQTSIALLAA